MSTTFPDYKGLNLPNVAVEMLKFWEEHDIFNKSITTRDGQKPFVFFEGPPSRQSRSSPLEMALML